ncbi:MAG: ABC transporter ATP-binding protein [Proteobacteria bacterium]|jgi:lipopolysaccharide transport system ATP-binding protein|nr:ABC transporter ATP-binding protein [Pseudomonadota bacterium]
MTVVSLQGVGKAFRSYSSQWDRLREWVLPGLREYHLKTWILRDVSFELNRGEAVGLAGMNGAGKSTLLKIIAGITQPTLGKVQIAGRLSALLELGMGFHPDFTGRQNVITAGQLLGIPLDRLQSLMPEIERFAEIGDYFDQPVRVYSSGMQMRLAFSVATAERPDVLIIDEALSVGDAYFQHKSFDRIKQFKAAGTSLILVSHDRFAIQSICDRAILLSGGTVAQDGDPESVLDYYNATISGVERIEQQTEGERTRTTSGDGSATVTAVSLCAGEEKDVDIIRTGASVVLSVSVRVEQDIERLVCGYAIRNRYGQDMYGVNTFHTGDVVGPLVAGDELTFRFAFDMNLGPGEYSLATALAGGETHLEGNYEWRDLARVFSVENTGQRAFSGCVWMEPVVSVERSS